MQNKNTNKLELGVGALWKWLRFIWVIPVIGFFVVRIYDFGKVSNFANFVYGTTAPLLTFISFLAVVITVRTQKEQLELQNQQLINSMKEMQETRKDMERQNKTLSVQRFENTFFQMVNLHNQIVQAMYASGTHATNNAEGTHFLIFLFLSGIFIIIICYVMNLKTKMN
jgi:hypothetical protein